MLKLTVVTLGISLTLFQVSFAFNFPSGFFSIGNEYPDLKSEHQNPDINLNRSRFTRSIETGDLGQRLGRCKATEFACNDGSCIKLKLKCDGDEDCDDGSDELPLICNPSTEPPTTTTESLCAKNQFQCSDGSCIKAKFKCDGDVDCSDGSDESPAFCSEQAEPTIPTTTTTTTPKPLCRDNQFQCSDNSCIKFKLKCDGDEDCPDGSDEFSATCNEAELLPAPRMLSSKSYQQPENEQKKKEIQDLQTGQDFHEADESGIETAPEFPLGARTNDDEEIITEAERLIQAGDTHIRDDEQYRNVILVAGNSGAGKSTLAKFLTTDDITELESLWVGDRFIIKDKEGLISTGKASVVSKSIFPKLMINSKTNDAFYDLPGFGDTRGPAVEIANADFIKRVADRSRRVKILFVVNYSSLKSGETRSDFRNLLESAADYIKNPRKFKPAIALVANKVDVDMPTNSIIPAVAQFLKNARDSLPEIMQDDPVKRDQIAEILNTLLIKDKKGTGYARLGYFKQPDRAGLLSQIPSAQSAKILLNKIVGDNTGIQFVTKSSDDFGLSMSPSTRLFATSAVRNIHRNVAQLSEEFGGKIKEYFQNKGGSIYALLQDYTTDLELLKNQTETLLEISKVQGLGQSPSSTLGTREEFQGVTSTYEQLAQAFNLNQVGNVETIIESLARHLEHLAVLEPLVTIKRSASDIGSGTGVRTKSNAIQLWATSLQHAAEDIRSTIYNMKVDINDAVYGAITTITNEIEELYRLKLDILYDSISNDISTDEAINEVDENLQEDSKVLQDLVDGITARLQASSPESEQLTFDGFTNETIKLLSTLKIGLQPKSIDLLKLPLKQDLNLGNLPNRPSPFTPMLWLKPVDKLVGFLHQEQQNLNAVLQETSHLYRKQALEVETQGQVQVDVETQIKEGRENVENAQTKLLEIPQNIQNTVESERKLVEENSAKFNQDRNIV